MFGNQSKLAVTRPHDLRQQVGDWTPRSSTSCLDSGQKKTLVEEDQKAAASRGVRGAGVLHQRLFSSTGAQPYEVSSNVYRE